MRSLGSRLRDEFPRGWWRSGRWWISGLAEIGIGLLAIFATSVLIVRVVRSWQDRDDPSRLRSLDRTIEGYVGGGLLYGGGLLGLLLPGVRAGLGSIPLGLLIGMMLWCLANVAVSVSSVVIVVRSRWTRWVHWSMIDFVDEHAPANGRAPQTAEEYQAQRLSSSV